MPTDLARAVRVGWLAATTPLLLLGGCTSAPIPTGAPTTPAPDATPFAVAQVAVDGARSAILGYVAAHGELPSLLADVGYATPIGVQVAYEPGAGTAFCVAAQEATGGADSRVFVATDAGASQFKDVGSALTACD